MVNIVTVITRSCSYKSTSAADVGSRVPRSLNQEISVRLLHTASSVGRESTDTLVSFFVKRNTALIPTLHGQLVT